MTNSFWKKSENLFALGCLTLSVLAYLFLGSLIAQPKVLFGKSLTAITPSSFPSIVLGLLIFLCLVHLLLGARKQVTDDSEIGIAGWRRGGIFFGIMTVYGLLLVPLGFIISSTLAIAVLSWFTGNRSIVQIVLVALIAPVLLYLSATRLLAVSLPELNFIEIALSRLLGE